MSDLWTPERIVNTSRKILNAERADQPEILRSTNNEIRSVGSVGVSLEVLTDINGIFKPQIFLIRSIQHRQKVKQLLLEMVGSEHRQLRRPVESVESVDGVLQGFQIERLGDIATINLALLVPASSLAGLKTSLIQGRAINLLNPQTLETQFAIS